MSLSLAEALPLEMRRVRFAIYEYLAIGRGGLPAAAMMEAELRRAEEVLGTDDVIKMLQVHEILQAIAPEFELEATEGKAFPDSLITKLTV